MNRRQFIRVAGAATAAVGLSRVAPASPQAKRPRVAVTMDDFNLFDTPALSAAARNDAILEALGRRRLRAALFVAARNVESATNMALLRRWDERGHLIGNHTYSHPHYPDKTFEEFTRDVLRAEEVLKVLPRYRKLFRFPYLKEGRTREQRDRMRAFLKARGYRNGHVTIDASDWYVDQRLRERLKKDPRADRTPYRDFYLGHIRERALFYEDLARRVLGRGVRHTLLVHHNVLNGLFLGDLLGMFEREGWELMDADDAFKDPVFDSEPDIAPAGESLVWALAKQTGRFEHLLRYPGEDGEYEKARMDALGL
ncbi:MAG TPA: polysaccharide deacetylase family protein [Pyrinomonadaceae bacterium]|nr:polysaccharide deacetylase family protein [Pyrinomonadaceae bacterium]